MARRIHVSRVYTGQIPLNEREAHHVRDVLRLRDGDGVEAFDDAGRIGHGILNIEGANVSVRVENIREPSGGKVSIVIASAIPKAGRADWLIEKLSELGIDVFIPLAAARSVVVPEGKNKLDRWTRLAVEAAKQSHRTGVMRIEPVTTVNVAVAEARSAGEAWCLSTSKAAKPILRQLRDSPPAQTLTLFIGPEGDWSEQEVDAFHQAGVPGISLGETILRVETAALMTASILTAFRSDSAVRQSPPAP